MVGCFPDAATTFSKPAAARERDTICEDCIPARRNIARQVSRLPHTEHDLISGIIAIRDSPRFESRSENERMKVFGIRLQHEFLKNSTRVFLIVPLQRVPVARARSCPRFPPPRIHRHSDHGSQKARIQIYLILPVCSTILVT